MAITLRNKRIEDKIRAIGRRTGEGPSAVIARLVETAEPGTPPVDEAEAARRRAENARAFLATFPPWTDQDRAAVRQVMEDMYDEQGLPK